MRKKGFTLIELLIVIMIIAILTGVAMPYVQNYLDDARLSTAKSDLNEIRNAITRYETDQSMFFDPGFSQRGGTTEQYKEALKAFQQKLVGPYLIKAFTDPWGRPYYFSYAASMVFSGADDGDLGTNIISMDVRPLMAPSRAWWSDYNNNGRVDTGDVVDIKFSRPIGGCNMGDANANFTVTPPKSTTAYTNPFGTNSKIEDFSGEAAGEMKHPRGNNWVRIAICEDSEIQPGDCIVASTTFYDTTEAAIVGGCGPFDDGIGLYQDDKVKYEPWFPDNGTVVKDFCHDTMIRLKAAQ